MFTFLKKLSRKSSGFTLIELLVVVSIIGVLASVVLASLNSARAKGKDAAIKEQILQYRTLLELNKSETGSYAELQPIDPPWLDSTSCNSYFSGNYAAQAREICLNLVRLSGTSIYIGLYQVPLKPPTNYYSLMVYLPFRAKFLCVGTSGISENVNVGSWIEPGCTSNP